MFIGNDIIDDLGRLWQNQKEDRQEIKQIFLEKLRRIVKKSHAYQFFSKRIYAFLIKIGVRAYYGVKMQYDYMMVKNYSPEVKRGLEYTKEDFIALRKTCRDNNIRLIVVLIPLRDQVTNINWNKFSAYHYLYDRDNLHRVLKEILGKEVFNFTDKMYQNFYEQNKETLFKKFKAKASLLSENEEFLGYKKLDELKQQIRQLLIDLEYEKLIAEKILTTEIKIVDKDFVRDIFTILVDP